MSRCDEKTPKQRHRPPHFVSEGRAIFITAATLDRIPHLRTAERRDTFVRLLVQHSASFDIELVAWVVLREHYHAVVRPERPEAFSSWIGAFHGAVSSAVNAEDGMPGRQVWYQYWDSTLWTEGDFWSRVNYVHRNPVKHGYVEDALAWPWSTYPASVEWDETPELQAALARFPAPRKLPHDDF